jgi:hypothetical protein
MARLDLGGRIMLAIGAGTVLAAACGGGVGVSSSGTSIGGSGGGSSTGDAGDEHASDDEGGAPLEGGSDAMDATLADGDGAVCGEIGTSCAQSSDCCAPATCNGQHCFISVRRPFLVGSSLRVADAAPRGDWQAEGGVHDGGDPQTPATGVFDGGDPQTPATGVPDGGDLDPATAAALARDYLHDACEEYASIAAFARFTMHLVSLGAPPEMIAESQRASLDEIEHARACFALARRYGGQAMGPGALSLEGAMPAMTLADIAALTAEEGCVGETLGVLLAERQLATATDPHVRSLLVSAHILEDEARHAELAWRFVAWAVARGGEPVRRAVRAAIRRAVADTLAMPIRSYAGVDVDAWRAHGRLTCADAHAVAERGVRELVEPCAAALLGDPPPRPRSTDLHTCAT